MSSRGELFLNAVEAIEGGSSVEIVGEFGSGRTYLLNQIRAHFTSLGWQICALSGVKGLQRSRLTALAIAGLIEGAEAGSNPAAAAYLHLSMKLRQQQQSVLIIDDSDWLDELSWGVITAVSAEHNVPVVFVSLVHLSWPATHQHLNGAESVCSLELAGLPYAEFATTLEGITDAKFDALTLSRVYAKAGGNVGLAIAIVESARRADRIELDDGILHATGPLWTSALRSLAKAVLEPLGQEEIHVLRSLALLGPAALNTAAKVAPLEVILRLEEQSYVKIIEVSHHQTVTVRPSLLVEYFRHEMLPGQRAGLMEKLDVTLAEPLPLVDEVLQHIDDPAMFVRLVHERARLQTLQAREAWHRTPSFVTAAQVLRALGADTMPYVEEIESLILASQQLVGSAEDQVDWELAYSAYLANHRRKPIDALHRLRWAIDQYPDAVLPLSAQAVLLDMTYGNIPEDEPFADLDLDEISGSVRPQILLARAAWLAVRGRTSAADKLLAAHLREEDTDSRLQSLIIYLHLARGRLQLAANAADKHLADAISFTDARRVRVFAYLKALISILTQGYADAERSLKFAASLGVSAGETPTVHVGEAILEAYFAVKRGQLGRTEEILASLNSQDWPDGILPGQQRSLIHARRQTVNADPAAFLRIAMESGDALWKRGARLAAIFTYLDGIQVYPDRESWEAVAPKLRQIDSPAMALWGRFVEKLVRQDADSLASFLPKNDRSPGGVDPAKIAQVALKALTPSDATTDGRNALEKVAASGMKSAPVAPVELSPRELEVARLIAAGLSNPKIANTLFVSVRTVESHVNRLSKKIGVTQRSEFRAFLLATGTWA